MWVGDQALRQTFDVSVGSLLACANNAPINRSHEPTTVRTSVASPEGPMRAAIVRAARRGNVMITASCEQHLKSVGNRKQPTDRRCCTTLLLQLQVKLLQVLLACIICPSELLLYFTAPGSALVRARVSPMLEDTIFVTTRRSCACKPMTVCMNLK